MHVSNIHLIPFFLETFESFTLYQLVPSEQLLDPNFVSSLVTTRYQFVDESLKLNARLIPTFKIDNISSTELFFDQFYNGFNNCTLNKVSLFNFVFFHKILFFFNHASIILKK